jgi:hypothetical protein
VLLTPCGAVCKKCEYYNDKCAGCLETGGSPFWSRYIEQEKCILYDCCINERGYLNCGNCEELPCTKIIELKEPNITQEEHIKRIKRQVRRLRTYNKKNKSRSSN